MKLIFGILLCSHGSLAQGMLEATKMISGDHSLIKAVCFNEGDEISSFQYQLLKQANCWKSKISRLICLCDLQGATPYNACLMSFAMDNTILVSGMNLPLVLKLLTLQQQDIEGKKAVEMVLQDQDILPVMEECEILFASLKEIKHD